MKLRLMAIAGTASLVGLILLLVWWRTFLYDKNSDLASARSVAASTVRSLDVSSTGPIATGHSDGSITIWDPDTLEPTSVLKGPETAIACLAFSADGLVLISNGLDNQALVWDLKNKEVSATLATRGWLRSIGVLPDGKTVVTGAGEFPEGEVQFWDLASHQSVGLVKDFRSRIETIGVSAKRMRFIARSELDPIHEWDIATGRKGDLVRESPLGNRVVAYSSDGRLLALGGLVSPAQEGKSMGCVDILDTATWKAITSLHVPAAFGIHAVSFSRDNRYLAAASSESIRARGTNARGELALYDLATGKRLFAQVMPTQALCVSFSANGKLIYVGGGDLRTGNLTAWHLDKILQPE